MPARDGRGPAGQGPRTGRGMGNCKPGSSEKATGAETAWTGTAYRDGPGWFGFFGRWFGRGRRFRNQRR